MSIYVILMCAPVANAGKVHGHVNDHIGGGAENHCQDKHADGNND